MGILTRVRANTKQWVASAVVGRVSVMHGIISSTRKGVTRGAGGAHRTTGGYQGTLATAKTYAEIDAM